MSINSGEYQHPIEADARWVSPFVTEGHMENYYGEDMAPAPDSNDLSGETTLEVSPDMSPYEEQLLEVMLEIAAIAEMHTAELEKDTEACQRLNVLEAEAIILEAEISLEHMETQSDDQELEDILTTLLVSYAERHYDLPVDEHRAVELRLLAEHYADFVRKTNLGADYQVLEDVATDLLEAIAIVIEELRSQHIDESLEQLTAESPLVGA